MGKWMKVLRVIDSVNPERGGPINGLINSSRLLQEDDVSIQVLSLDDPRAPWVAQFEFPLMCFKGKLGKYAYNPAFYRWLMEHLHEFDMVIIHGLWQYHCYAAAKACVNCKVPYLLFTHGMMDPWFNKNNSLKTIKKNIYWYFLERFSVNRATAVLFTSEEERRLAATSFPLYHPEERVVAYGSALPNFEKEVCKQAFMQRFPELHSKKILLFLSRIHPKKGIDLLISAFAAQQHQYKDTILVIAGPDNTQDKKALQQKIEHLRIEDKVLWCGMLKGTEKWGAYYSADCFVLPSHQENFGIVVTEALSAELPVLISDKVNIWREIKAEGAGFVAPDTEEGTAELLQKWYDTPIETRNKMREQAKFCYQQNFSMVSAVADLKKLMIETR